jgi:hypothetical protein
MLIFTTFKMLVVGSIYMKLLTYKHVLHKIQNVSTTLKVLTNSPLDHVACFVCGLRLGLELVPAYKWKELEAD